ncbi:MAG: hypothetical protein B6I17_04145 [Tenericutes bacterium 4572_104]|nr:MAG: hypothetical protein B6I17_04145 [Tenericutes bacterium 4572_104]
MKKLLSFLCIAVLAASSAYAGFEKDGFSAGFAFRMRGAMETVTEGTDADTQAYNRYTDIRVRPSFGYKVNNMVSAKLTFEVGDVTFGVDKDKLGRSSGGGYMADGVNVETKHAYIDIKPNKNHSFRAGLQPYLDKHSLIFDEDLAGIKWDGKFDKVNTSLAWFVTEDNGEENIDEATYSFGNDIILAELGYTVNKDMKIGLTNIIQMTKTEATIEGEEKSAEIPDTNLDEMGIWIAPHFQGDFGKFDIGAVFAYNMRSAEFDKVKDNELNKDLEDPDDQSGMAFSLKANIKPDKKLNIGLNFLYTSGDEDGKDYYKDISHFYGNGLEILSGGCAIDRTTHGWDGTIFSDKGTMLPVATVDYKVNKNFTIGGAFGMAMTLEDVKYGEESDTNLGMEFDVKAKVKMCDAINVTPFAAFFMPGDAFAYQNGQVDEKGDALTDMQIKIGFNLGYSF